MADTETTQNPINYPAWTVYNAKNGLDPLGMQNTSINRYQSFLPGISNVTLRMRYYGFYAWLNYTYVRGSNTDNPEDWKRFLRRAEALYALITYRAGQGAERGVAGIDWAGKAHDNTPGDTIDIAVGADPESDQKQYLQQAWGAYGAAYGNPLHEIGILTSSTDHKIPVPTPDMGEPLGQAFEDALGTLADLFVEVIERGTVSREELDRLAPMAPSEIARDGRERALYQQLLLSPGSAEEEDARARRLTFLLVMHVAGLRGAEPGPDDVRWTLYAGQDQNGRPLELPTQGLEEQRQRWWVYHANDLCHIALETLLKFTLDTLSRYPAGITLDGLIRASLDGIEDEVGPFPGCWADFLGTITCAANAYAADDPAAEHALTSTIMAGAGRGDKSACTPETAWAAIHLLAVLDKRGREESHPIDDELKDAGTGAQTLLTETQFLQQRESEPFRKLLAEVIEQRVIRRHLWVASQKFRYGDYTFLLEADEGRLRLRDKDGPMFTNPRLAPALTFLRDIYLVGGQGLTDYGSEAVAQA